MEKKPRQQNSQWSAWQERTNHVQSALELTLQAVDSAELLSVSLLFCSLRNKYEADKSPFKLYNIFLKEN